jgi:hypothetical protein
MATYHINPKRSNRTEREDASTLYILEAETENKNNDFRNVNGEQVNNESLGADKETTAFADGDTDRVEVAKQTKGRRLG